MGLSILLGEFKSNAAPVENVPGVNLCSGTGVVKTYQYFMLFAHLYHDYM